MILCCGEAIMDMLPRRLPDGCNSFMPVPGGALYNTAVALGRLGEAVGFVSGISTDIFGQQLIAHLQESHVKTDYCIRSPDNSTLAFVTFTDGHAAYFFFDENSSGQNLDIRSVPPLPDSAKALHFGGISLISDQSGATYEILMRRNCDRFVISLDLNIRPKFIKDEPAYRARLQRMLAMSDLVKISEEDLEWLMPNGHFEQIAQSWLNSGVAIVILTKGEKGSRAITRDFDIFVPAIPVDIVDTIGAGDTFNAGFLACLRKSGHLGKAQIGKIDSSSLRKAIEYGSRVAAYTVGQAGANPPWSYDLA